MRKSTSLLGAKPVLFVHYRVGEVLELHGFLDKRMGADEHGDLAARDPFQKLRARNIGRSISVHFLPEFFAAASGHKRDIDRQMLEVFDEGLEVLRRQYFRRRHIGNLQGPACTIRWT